MGHSSQIPAPAQNFTNNFGSLLVNMGGGNDADGYELNNTGLTTTLTNGAGATLNNGDGMTAGLLVNEDGASLVNTGGGTTLIKSRSLHPGQHGRL